MNIFKITIILGGLIALWVLFSGGCSEYDMGNHLFTQPYTTDNYFFPATITDTAGNPIKGVSVSMDYVSFVSSKSLSGSLKKSNKPHIDLIKKVSITIYDMFDRDVKAIATITPCADLACVPIAPVWDETNESGILVNRGLYRYEKHITNYQTGELIQGNVSSWVALRGKIDESDGEGNIRIPALPDTAMSVSMIDSIEVKYYSGWIELSCTKTGYVDKKDTVYVFDNIKPIVLQKEN